MPRTQKLWVNITLWAVIIGFVVGGIIFFTPGGLQIFNINPNPQDEPALIVNGQKISETELEIAFQSLIQQYRQLYAQIGSSFDEQLEGANGGHYQLQLRSQAADGLIRQTLLEQEANRRRISVPRTQVDLKFRERYEQFLATNQITEERLQELLRDPMIRERFRQFFNLRTGTLSEFKDKLRTEAERELREQRLKEVIVGQSEPTDVELLEYVEQNKARYLARIAGPITPTEEELKSYFEQHRDKYAKQEIRVSHIFISLSKEASPSEIEAAQKKLQELKAQLEKKKADFAQLAKQHSQDEDTKDKGGDLGWMDESTASPYGLAFDQAAFSLEPGQISEVIHSDAGLHLIKVMDQRTKPFEEAQAQVRYDFLREQEEQRFAQWLKAARDQGIFPEQEEIHARHILIQVSQEASPEEVEAARGKILNLKKQLDAGANFAELAKEHSEDASNKNQGGDLGWFGRGSMAPEFEQAAFALKENQISDPVRTQFGFHLIQLLARRTTDALKHEIREAYTREQTEKRFEDWVGQITDSARIEVKDPLLAAFRTEERALAAEDLEEKLKLLEEAIAAYNQTQRELISDPYIGYYQSRLYREKLTLLQKKLASLEEGDEERARLEQQIERTRTLATESFLRSTYGAGDAAAFLQMLELNPDSAELHYSYARFLLDQQEELSQAYEELRKAVEIRPNYWQAQALAADIQMRNGVYASAIEHLKRALEAVQVNSREHRDLRLRLGRAYLSQARIIDLEENLTQAEQILIQLRDELTSSEASRADVLATLGDLYMERGDYRKAQDAYRESLKITPRTSIEVKLGRAYLSDKQFAPAEQAFQSVLARDAYAVEARVGLGDVYQAQNQLEKALKNYRDALDLATNAETKQHLIKQILAIDPQDQKTRFKLAQLHLDQGNYRGAIEQYQALLQIDPQSWQAQSGLGEAYLAQKEYAQAKDHLKSALRLNPPSEQQLPLYEKLLRADRELVGEGQTLTEDGQQALLQLAELYLKQGSVDKAKEQLKTLQSEYPDYQPTKVEELWAQAEGRGLPGDAVEDQGRLHIPNCQPSYNSVPPTSGCHSPSTASWGIHQEPIPNEIQVHNLEHGGVLIQYEPNVEETLVEQLTSFVERLREDSKYCKLILAPYPNLDKPIALTAWTRILKLDNYDEDQLIGFINSWIEKGPERGVPCS